MFLVLLQTLYCMNITDDHVIISRTYDVCVFLCPFHTYNVHVVVPSINYSSVNGLPLLLFLPHYFSSFLLRGFVDRASGRCGQGQRNKFFLLIFNYCSIPFKGCNFVCSFYVFCLFFVVIL